MAAAQVVLMDVKLVKIITPALNANQLNHCL